MVDVPWHRLTLLLLAVTLTAWYAPAHAASVGAVRSRSVAMSTTPQTVTLAPAVSPSRTVVLCSSRTNSSSPSSRPTCELTGGGATLTVALGIANANTVVQYDVVEFDGGATVQRGLASFGTSATLVSVPLTSVDLTRTFVLVGQRTTSTATGADERWTIRAQLTGATTLELRRNETGIAVDVAWQVVTLDGASVQRGLTTLGGATSTTASIGAVDPAKSFLVMSLRGATGVAGVESRYTVTGELTSPTQLTFTRVSSTSSVDISWEVVALDDGTGVQRGAAVTATSGVALMSAPLASVDTTVSAPLVTVAGGTGTSATRLDETSWTAALTSGTSLDLARAATGTTATAAWQVVSFFRCGAVANPVYASVAAADGQATLAWQSALPVLILRKTAPFAGEAPAPGQGYTVGGTIGAATVVRSGSVAETSFTDTGLTNGTTYYYQVYPKSPSGASTTCYASGAGTEASALPLGPASGVAWSYVLAGGSTLRAGIAGGAQLFFGSNASRLIGLDTGAGAESWTPIASGAPIQGWVTWLPGGGPSGTVYAGTQAGLVGSVDAATGAVNWATNLAPLGADAVQAAVSAQVRAFSDAAFAAAYPGAYDVLFVATRNASSTNNKIFALRSDTGAVLWTFDPQTQLGVPMDYVVGQPWVGYTRNRLYVGSRAGAAGTQQSFWVLDSLTGTRLVSAAAGHVEMSPSLSADDTTLYFANGAGQLFAGDADALSFKWSGPAFTSLGSAIVGYVWEDFTTAGRLYFSTADGSVRCLQDPGPGAPAPSAATPCSGWSTPTVAVAGPSAPLLLDAAWFDPLVAGLYVGSTDGRVHRIDPASGADTGQFTVGDGTRPVGDLSTEGGSELFAGTTEGKMFKLTLPLP